jgi:hypothetical protein
MGAHDGTDCLLMLATWLLNNSSFLSTYPIGKYSKNTRILEPHKSVVENATPPIIFLPCQGSASRFLILNYRFDI